MTRSSVDRGARLAGRARTQRRTTLLCAVLAMPTIACSEDPGTGESPPAATATSTTVAGDGPTTTVVLDPDRLPVVVTTAAVPAGTTADAAIDQGLLEASSVRFVEFPEDAVVTVDLLVGLVAAEDLPADTVLTAGDFVDPDARNPSGPGPDDPTLGGGDDQNDDSPPTGADGES